MPTADEFTPFTEADLRKVRTQPWVDGDVYARVLGLGRTAKYRALKTGQPIEPFKAGREYRIPTPPLRKLLHLEPPAAA